MQEMKRSSAEISSIFSEAKKMAQWYGQVGLVETDDIVQNTMIKVLRRQGEKSPTRGWLYMAVRCSAMDALRRVYRDEQETRYGTMDESCLECSDSHLVREDDSEIDLMPGLKNMLEKLSKPLKQVLVLYSEGASYQEIAELTNTNIGTVRSRLHYARRRAKRLMGEMM